MKRNFLVLMVAILALLLAPFALAGDTTESNTQMLVGARYDNDGGVTMTIGGIKKLGGNFYALGYGDVGTGQQSASLEGAYILTKGKLSFGALLGGNSDWEAQAAGTEDTTGKTVVAIEDDPINYLVAAGGFLVSYSVRDDIQVWAAYKHKKPLADNLYQSLNVFGLGVGFRF